MRVFALMTGTLGLLAVGVLIMTVTPQGPSAPVALSATTTPARVVALATPPTTTAPQSGRTTQIADVAAPASTRPSTVVSTPDEQHGDPLATPIADGRVALVTRAALDDTTDGSVSVRFTSGREGRGTVIDEHTNDHVVMIALADWEPALAVARDTPHDREIVKVMDSPPVTVAFGDVASLELREGTPVVDDDGALVGLCTHAADGGTILVEFRGSLADLIGSSIDQLDQLHETPDDFDELGELVDAIDDLIDDLVQDVVDRGPDGTGEMPDESRIDVSVAPAVATTVAP